MTHSIHHPHTGRNYRTNPLVAAAAVAVIAATFVVVSRVQGSESATNQNRTTTESVNTSAAQTEAERVTALNDIPWAPTATGTATDNSPNQARDLTHFQSINGVDALSAPSAATANHDNAFFLSINGVDAASTQSATTAKSDKAFFLSINNADE